MSLNPSLPRYDKCSPPNSASFAGSIGGIDAADCRRSRVPGSCYVFTVNLMRRHDTVLLIERIDLLRDAVRQVPHERPVTIDVWVVLPDYIRAVWTVPQGDVDFSTPWRLIGPTFSRGLPTRKPRSPSATASLEKRDPRRCRPCATSTLTRFAALAPMFRGLALFHFSAWRRMRTVTERLERLRQNGALGGNAAAGLSRFRGKSCRRIRSLSDGAGASGARGSAKVAMLPIEQSTPPRSAWLRRDPPWTR